MTGHARRPDPWLRSSTDARPRHLDPTRRPTWSDRILIAFVVLAVVAFFVWFLFLARGGPGWGTV